MMKGIDSLCEQLINVISLNLLFSMHKREIDKCAQKREFSWPLIVWTCQTTQAQALKHKPVQNMSS
jgi:hypothetical protein